MSEHSAEKGLLIPSHWNSHWNYHLGGEPRSVCACPDGPYYGAALVGTPPYCERCGGLTRVTPPAWRPMTAPDFASVLAAHAQYNAKRHPDDRWRYDGTHVCACGAEFKATRGIGGAIIAHRAHVAAALHAEWLRSAAEVWDEGHTVGYQVAQSREESS